jgi:hypothetical protein
MITRASRGLEGGWREKEICMNRERLKNRESLIKTQRVDEFGRQTWEMGWGGKNIPERVYY